MDAHYPEDELNPEDVGSIPCPDGVSRCNLRAEMGLDKDEKSRAFYTKIRVSPSM